MKLKKLEKPQKKKFLIQKKDYRNKLMIGKRN